MGECLCRFMDDGIGWRMVWLFEVWENVYVGLWMMELGGEWSGCLRDGRMFM